MDNRLKAAGGRANGDGTRKTRTRDRPRAVPAPEANAELQANIDVHSYIYLSYLAVHWHEFVCIYCVIYVASEKVPNLVSWLTQFFIFSLLST